MATIQYTNDGFSLEDASLSYPISIKEFNFSELTMDDEPVYAQLCEINIKNGICFDENENPYVDMFIDESDEETLSWFECLDDFLTSKLHSVSYEWFDKTLTEDDLSEAYTSSIKDTTIDDDTFLFRVYLPKNYKSRSNLNIYDDDEELLKYSILNDGDIRITPLIEVKGVKFDETTFAPYFVLRQAMVSSNEDNETSDEDDDSEDDDSNDSDDESQEEDNDADVKQDSLLGNEYMENNDETGESVDSDNEVKDKDETEVNDDNNSDDDEKHEPIDLQTNNIVDKLEEVTIELDGDKQEGINLSKPNEVYVKLWREAREKAKQAKNEAIKAYLEAKNIKSTWLVDETDANDENDDLEDIGLLLKNNMEMESKEPTAIEL